MNENRAAFLKAIRLGEGTSDEDGYRRIFGGELFYSFDDHPRKKVTKGRYTSTAAGAYQFLERTWDSLVKQHGYPDFSPHNQDLAAIELIRGRRALDDVDQGRIEAAVRKCNKEWASLPGSPYGQPTVTMDRFLEEYRLAGGYFRPVGTPAPVEDRMGFLDVAKVAAPFINPALGAVVSVVPELIRVFGDSPQAEKNAKAAEIVVNAAKDAAGAMNEQDLVEKINAGDPAVIQQVKDSVKEVWYEITEAGGGGVGGARDFFERVTGSGPAWRGIGYGILMAIIAIAVVVGGGSVMGKLVMNEGTDPTLTAQILDYFKAAGFIVLGYIFGSSVKQGQR